MGFEIEGEKGIANIGDLTRLRALMERAKRGDDIRIGFIGGSITQGSVSSKPEFCYAYRVFEWWRRTFPHAAFSYINAGIGGTTSQFGVARAGEDLLAKKPDFVIIEFSVNDESTEHFMETYEGLVRKVYGAAWDPAVLLVHNVFYHNGANAQVMHGRIGRYYELPAVSMQSSIFPGVVSGELDRRMITPDDLHPNDAGHELVAQVVTYFLDRVRSGEMSADDRPDGGKRSEDIGAEDDELKKADGGGKKNRGLPAPLTRNGYENSYCLRNDNCEPVLQGFIKDDAPKSDITDCFKKGWTASAAGDAILFSVKGSGIAVQYRKSVRHPAPAAEVIVDGDAVHAVRLDAEFNETWGDKLELETVLEHGEDKEHTVEIRLTEAHEEDAAPFYLVSVIVSGGDCNGSVRDA